MQPPQASDDGDRQSTARTESEGATPTSTETQLEARYARCQSETAGAELDLSGLGLTAFPPAALVPGRFPRLRALNLRQNQLSRLPDALGASFPLLISLDVSENLLEELPALLGASLGRLQRLVASSNRLRGLPASLARLDQLRELHVRDNRLEAIDEALGALPRLQSVDLGGNDALEDAPERLRRLHDRNLLLHSRAKRRELISRALRVRAAVRRSLQAMDAPADSPGVSSVSKRSAKRNTVA